MTRLARIPVNAETVNGIVGASHKQNQWTVKIFDGKKIPRRY